MKYITRSLLKVRIFTILLVLIALGAFMFVSAKPAHAGGGPACDIRPDGGAFSGNSTGPAALKVNFLDANGSQATAQISYSLQSTDGPNIAHFDNNANWIESSADVGGTSCYKDGENFDIWYYHTCPRGCGNGYEGNGWVLFCKIHPSGAPWDSTDTPAHFRITNIAALPDGGGAGGGKSGRWQLVWGPGDGFEVANGWTTYVTYRWVPDPDFGAIGVSKYFPSTKAYGDFSNTPADVNNALVKLYAQANTTSKYQFATSNDTAYVSNKPNPFVRNTVATSQNFFSARVYIPPGKRISRLEIYGRRFNYPYPFPWPVLRTVENCTFGNDAQGSFCDVPIFWVHPGETTWVDVFYDSVATNPSLSCIANGGDFYWDGWGIDMNNQPATPVIKIFDGNSLAQETPGNYAGANTLRIRGDKTTYPNASATTNYDIKHSIGPYFRDNTPRTVTIKLATTNGDQTLGTLSVGPGSACNPRPYQYPYLQVLKGNIIANGQINGQTASSTRPGARLPSSVDKDVEYLVISAVGKINNVPGGPFCSNKNYILTNVTAVTDVGCSNGEGYGNMPDYLFGGSSDKVYAAVNKKYESFTKSDCKPNALPLNGDIASNPAQDKCPEGTIFKINGPIEIGPLTVSSGRATILVNGDVTIKGNIDYKDVPYPGDLLALKNLPNLSIVASGNIKIRPNVFSLKASLYSVGYTSTCSDTLPPDYPLCSNSLYVKGGIAAKNGLILGRVDKNNGLTGHNPAELLIYYPLSLILSTPGTSSNDFSVSTNDFVTDPTEYPPRF